jgi:hypothetical protein
MFAAEGHHNDLMEKRDRGQEKSRNSLYPLVSFLHQQLVR